MTPAARLAAGMRVIPQDRRNEALVLGWSIAENVALGRHQTAPLRRGAVIDRAAERAARAEERDRERFDVRPPDPRAIVDALSGGNQQKIVVGRALGAHPQLIVAYQPTRGIDVGAATLVQSRLIEARNARRRGTADLVRARRDLRAGRPRARDVGRRGSSARSIAPTSIADASAR